MSLFTQYILPALEKELIATEPLIAQFILKQLHNVANDVLIWCEDKIQVDLNMDGKIGTGEQNAAD